MSDNLLGIMEIIGDKREEIIALAQKHHASNLRVFGSVARHEATSESDLDLMADFDEGASLIDLVGLKQDLEDLLGRKVDVLTERSLRGSLRDEILKDIVVF
jgi:uncharacterized protein